MLFLPLFLLLLPFLVDGRPYEICHKDACLQYSAICDDGRGVWTAKTKNEKMDDSRCTLSEDDFKRTTNGKSGENYFYLTIDVLSPTQWTLSIFTHSSIQRSFYIKSPRIDLRENKTDEGWDLTVDGEAYRKPFRLIESKSYIMEWTFHFNETTPLLDLFSDAQFAITINNTNATYNDHQFLTLVAERGPMSCTRRDTKPAFLVILIAYAVFATIVAILLLIMIYCIAREAKYKRVSTSESIPRKLERKEKEKKGRKESELEPNLPDLDPTTQGTTRDSTTTKEAQISATDISRLKTESKSSLLPFSFVASSRFIPAMAKILSLEDIPVNDIMDWVNMYSRNRELEVEDGSTDGISNELNTGDGSSPSSGLDAGFSVCGMRNTVGGPSTPALEFIFHPLPEQYTHFEELRREEKGCNVIIEIGDHRMNGHRALLSARCPYFKARFNPNFGDRDSPVITLSSTSGVNAEMVKELINYIYTGRLTISNENVQELLLAASFLMMESVVSECDSFIRKFIRHEDVLPMRTFCEYIGYEKLDQFLMRNIELNFIPISFTHEFAGLSFDGLVTLLERDSLRVDDEKQVFDVVDRWINSDSERMKYSAQLLRLIHWPSLPSSFIDEIVEKKEWVINCPEADEIISETKNRPLSSTIPPRKRADSVNLIVAVSNFHFFIIHGGKSFKMAAFNPITNTVKYGWTESPVEQTVNIGRHTCYKSMKEFFMSMREYDFVFDATQNTWMKVPSVPVGKKNWIRGIIGNSIIVAGGEYRGMAVSSAFRFNTSEPEKGWTELNRMHRRRYGAASCTFDGKFFVFGGDDHHEYLTHCECYDPLNNEWSEIAPMLTLRRFASAVEFKGRIFIAGGGVFSENRGAKKTESYDPISNTWTKHADLIHGRYVCTLAVSNGRLFVAGGRCEGEIFSIEEYLPETDEWIERGEMRMDSMDPATILSVPVPASIPIEGIF